jgi:hypothetical protein
VAPFAKSTALELRLFRGDEDGRNSNCRWRCEMWSDLAFTHGPKPCTFPYDLHSDLFKV